MDLSSGSSGYGNATLGYGTVASRGDDLAAIDAAARLAPAGKWLRLYLTSPSTWQASQLMASALVKRAADNIVALEWQSDGSGLGDRRAVVTALLATQAGRAQWITWQIDQLQAMSWTGLSPVATEAPFGWEWKPQVSFPGLDLPNLDLKPLLPFAIGLGALLLLKPWR